MRIASIRILSLLAIIGVALHPTTAAGRELKSLEQIANGPDVRALDNPAFPASATLGVAAKWLAGKVALARGDQPGAIDQLKQALSAEEALPYMEPSFWPIPVRPTLGAVLLQGGHPGEAEQVFRDDLKKWPRNAWSLHGLDQCLRAKGRNQSADLVRREFEEAWQRADVDLDMSWF